MTTPCCPLCARTDEARRPYCLVAQAYGKCCHQQSLIERIKSLTQKTCDCDTTIGYHTKECDMMPFGYNAALEDVVRIIGSNK